MKVLLPLVTLLVACQPNFMKVDEANTNTVTDDNGSAPNSDPVEDPDTPPESETTTP